MGSNVIFPGDKRISYRNIQSLIDTNNKAIELYQTLISDEGIEFHPQLSDNKNKIKALDLSFKFQQGGQGFTQWGREEETGYYFNYNIPTNTKTIHILALGYFTDEQLTQINRILQQVLDSAF